MLSLLSQVDKDLPILAYAIALQEQAATVGFDWQHAAQILDKIQEEVTELSIEMKKNQSLANIEEELGDVFFSCLNLARFLRLNPEQLLRKSCNKFISRFHYIEQTLAKQNKSLNDATQQEMEAIWQQSKITV